MIGHENTYLDHVEERTLWERWLCDQLATYLNEPLLDQRTAFYSKRVSEFRVGEMMVDVVEFTAWFSQNDHFISVPIQYLFHPVAWRAQRLEAIAQQERATAKAEREAAERALERRREQYAALHAEFGQPQAEPA